MVHDFVIKNFTLICKFIKFYEKRIGPEIEKVVFICGTLLQLKDVLFDLKKCY